MCNSDCIAVSLSHNSKLELSVLIVDLALSVLAVLKLIDNELSTLYIVICEVTLKVTVSDYACLLYTSPSPRDS